MHVFVSDPTCLQCLQAEAPERVVVRRADSVAQGKGGAGALCNMCPIGMCRLFRVSLNTVCCELLVDKCAVTTFLRFALGLALFSPEDVLVRFVFVRWRR
jgi:hypothetical protein